MEIVLQSYEDRLTIVTRTGTRIEVRPVEIKKQLGVSGTTDQIEVTSSLPVRIGKPALTGANDNYQDKSLPDTRKGAVRILFGTNHWDDLPGDPLDAEEQAEVDEEENEWNQIIREEDARS